MLEFYRKAIATFLGLVVLTALLAYICVGNLFVRGALLPADERAIPWKSETVTDMRMGGSSSVSIIDDIYFPNVFAVAALFSCHEGWSEVAIDLKHLKVPRWWLDMEQVDISDQNYRMDKVIDFPFFSCIVSRHCRPQAFI